ncbi:hypothetical protein C1H46_025193 [Malus baccata]|uniref:Uncharacterized protein n=1 Tax=Malus baccata TaxID=106549 RepID=A0A540LRW4_MALBA|nr:hypothetical protein C1H46_025193 [Malus baccata]
MLARWQGGSAKHEIVVVSCGTSKFEEATGNGFRADEPGKRDDDASRAGLQVVRYQFLTSSILTLTLMQGSYGG